MDTREIRAAPANAAPNRVTTCVISDPRKIDPGECKSGWLGQVRRGGVILPTCLPRLTAPYLRQLQPRAHACPDKRQEPPCNQHSEPRNQRYAPDDFQRYRCVLARRD